MMKPQAFVENVMLRSMIKDLADALERELRHRYKDAKGHRRLECKLEQELEIVRYARNRLSGAEC